MKKIIVIGDVHFKQKQPYLDKIKEFFQWLLTNYPDSILIQTGDFFDTSSPHSEFVVDSALQYLTKFSEVHIITGNHELSNRVGNPLIPLNRISNINIYSEPKEVVIQGIKFLMLPFLYNIKEMKEKYEKADNIVDYVISHVAYPGTNFGAPDEINLSKIRATTFIYGHIHQPIDKPNHKIIGVPVTTRYGEQDWKKRLVVVTDSKNFEVVNLPEFVTFETVKFGEDPKSKDSILNITNSPSVKSVLDKYKGYFLRLEGITLTGTDEKITYNEQKEFLNFSLEKNFQDFSKTIEIQPRIQKKIQEIFTRINF